MSEIPAPGGLEPTQDERTMATLAHALQIIGSWIAPLVIFLVNRKSRFVSFHALQALLLQLVHLVVLVVMMVGFFVIMGATIAMHGLNKAAGPPPVAFFIVFPLLWLGLVLIGIGILAIAIVYSIKAGRGEWAEYPVLGRLARKMLKIGPGGAVISPQT